MPEGQCLESVQPLAVQEISDRFRFQTVLQRRPVLFLAVGPLEHDDSLSGYPLRLPEHPRRFLRLVQHVSEERQVERPVGERQPLRSADLESSRRNVTLGPLGHFRIQVDAGDVETQVRERFREYGRARPHIEYGLDNQFGEADGHDPVHFQKGQPLGRSQPRGVAVEEPVAHRFTIPFGESAAAGEDPASIGGSNPWRPGPRTAARSAASRRAPARRGTAHGGFGRSSRDGRLRGPLVGPRREQLHEHPEDREGEEQEEDRGKQPLARRELHLVGRVAEEALREQLAADHHVPAHREDADEGQRAGHDVDPLPRRFTQADELDQRQERDREERPDDDLHDHLRGVQPRVDHEVEALERLVRFVDPVDEVEHLEAEVDDECVQEVAGDRVHAGHVRSRPLEPGDRHVEEEHRGDPGDDRRKEEHDRHQRGGPPGIRLDRAEDEPDVAVQQERGRDPDDGDDPADLRVEGQRALGQLVRAEGQGPVHEPHHPARLAREPDDVRPVVQPDLEQEHHEQVPEVDEAEHRHGGGRVRGQVHLVGPLRMAEVDLQRQRRREEEREGGEEREPVRRLHRLDVEHPLERGEDERARDEPGDERVENDEDAPLELDLVGVHVALDALQHAFHGSPTSPSRRGRCSKSSSPWPSAASGPAPCGSSGTLGSGRAGP